MPENKSFKEKIKGVFEAKTLAIIGLIIMSTWNFVSDTFKEGADSKFNRRVEVVVRSKNVKLYLDSLVDNHIETAMDNPLIWFDVLNSDFIGEYSRQRANEVREEVERKLIKMDSIQKSFIKQLGEGWGVRDDKVIDLFIDLGKKFIEGRLGVRTVSANF